MTKNEMTSITDNALAENVGHRLAALRIRRGLRQQDLAVACGLSQSTIKNLEKGKGTLLNMIALMRGLDALEAINDMLPEPSVSPMKMLVRGKKPQKRVRLKAAFENQDKGESAW